MKSKEDDIIGNTVPVHRGKYFGRRAQATVALLPPVSLPASFFECQLSTCAPSCLILHLSLALRLVLPFMFSALLAKEFVFEFLFLFGAASSLINVPHCLNAAIFSTSLACSSNGASDLLTQYGEEERVLQVDSDIAYFHPWTHEPVCTQFLESVGSELCIYTNASFSNGRGISIFTTPSIAEQFSKLLPFEDAAVLDGVNNPGGPWYTKELPGKGTGLIAGRELARGDLVTAYTPVLLVNKDRILSTRDRELLLRIAVDQLPSASRDAYLKLSTIFGNPAFIVQDVLKANNFEMQLGGEMHLALFPETSRMNHDCGPKYIDLSLAMTITDFAAHNITLMLLV